MALTAIGVVVGGLFALNAEGGRAKFEAFVVKVNTMVDSEREITSSLDTSSTRADVVTAARSLGSLADQQIAWLDGNPPSSCYSEAWKASR